jgi:ubiquinone/menaquinone biosynthesis C-methylase UbiE
MDYDRTTIAATYDKARAIEPGAMRMTLEVLARYSPADPGLILDVGCGTGRFTQALAERLQSRVLGVDPSATMLEAARGNTTDVRVAYARTPAENLPVENGAAGMVFMSMMLHHLDDAPRAARECRRVLRTGGRVCVRNTTRESLYPQSRFFPGFQQIVDRDLPSRDEVVTLFEDAGLRLWAYQIMPSRVAANWQELADKIALRADSFIVRLPLDEFGRGMAALRAHAEGSDPGQAIHEHIHFFAFEA